MNQWLTESEKLIKNEEKIGSDIDVLQEQIKDNQVGLKSLFHATENTANQNTWKAVVYSTIFYPTLPSCDARISQWLCWVLHFQRHVTSDSWDITWYTIQKALRS